MPGQQHHRQVGDPRHRDEIAEGVIRALQVEGRRPDTWLLPALPQFIVEVEGRVLVDLPLGMLPDSLAGDDESIDGTPEEPGA